MRILALLALLPALVLADHGSHVHTFTADLGRVTGL